MYLHKDFHFPGLVPASCVFRGAVMVAPARNSHFPFFGSRCSVSQRRSQICAHSEIPSQILPLAAVGAGRGLCDVLGTNDI